VSSRYTRIILMGEDEQGVREFTISHIMVWLLGVLGILLALSLMAVFFSYGKMVSAVRYVPDLERELVATRAQLVSLDSLRTELDSMAGMQEQLLLMLGIEAVDADSSAADATLARLAGAVQTPPPDAWPASGFVTREFIEGNAPEGVRPHLGLDIAGPEGAPILAAGDGVVARSGTDPYLGNFVEIQHGMGYLTVYGHCQQVAVARGTQVRRGQVVAYMGATGEATASHLHFEIWHNGMAVDPRGFLSGEPAQP